METFSISLGECLAEGAVIIPNIIFAGLIFGHYGDYRYLLPFVLLYSFEKASVFAIQGFGYIKNPYKILKYGLSFAMIGTVCCLFGTIHYFLWEIGAIFIGIGLANYAALFRTVRDISKEKDDWNYGNSLAKGYLLLALFLIFIEVLHHSRINIIFLAFLLVLFIIYHQICKLQEKSILKLEKPFEKKEGSFLYFIPFLVILAVTFLVRLLKQTSDIHYISFLLLISCIVILVGFFCQKSSFRPHSIQTLWFGAVRNFLIIFSIIYFTAINQSYMVSLSYLMIVVGVMLSMVLKVTLRKKFSDNKIQIICYFAIIFTLLLLFGQWTYLIGIMLCCSFVSTGNSIALKRYTEDNSFPVMERRIVRSKFYGLGAIIQQIILISSIFFSSFIVNHDSEMALRAYSYSNGTALLKTSFGLSQLICIFILIISGIYMVIYTQKNQEK